MKFFESLITVGGALSAIAGALIAFGAIISAVDRVMTLSRARRRIGASKALVREAHPDLRAAFERIQKEDSAHYLALVQARADYRSVGIYASAILAVLTTAVLALGAFLIGAIREAWNFEFVFTIAIYASFAIAAAAIAVRQSANRYRHFLDNYHSFNKLALSPVANTEIGERAEADAGSGPSVTAASRPDLESDQVSGRRRNFFLWTTPVCLVACVAIVAFSAGRYFTESGKLIYESGNPIPELIARAVLVALFIVTAVGASAGLRLLFEERPRRGHTVVEASSPSESEDSIKGIAPGEHGVKNQPVAPSKYLFRVHFRGWMGYSGRKSRRRSK